VLGYPHTHTTNHNDKFSVPSSFIFLSSVVDHAWRRSAASWWNIVPCIIRGGWDWRIAESELMASAIVAVLRHLKGKSARGSGPKLTCTLLLRHGNAQLTCAHCILSTWAAKLRMPPSGSWMWSWLDAFQRRMSIVGVWNCFKHFH